ncbi:hypothetical protein V1502_18720 [Bacillus sp. SCS-153A]|uniref:hypothetical protein n=1 Tax=Rossellomorea sedimentorum TaxID=3115294 RepID=UPI0039066367
MDEQQWEKFENLWDSGDYKEAVKVTLFKQNLGGEGVIDNLFRSPAAASASITGISFIDILYDYLMINPAVIEAVDFAKSEDLGNFFTFQLFAENFDFHNTGELTRLKGYTAEQLVALELQGKGHDVSFPDTSNQAGYDLIVDGQPFQVKCLDSPGGVYEHLRTYPDTPVLVNKELMTSFENHPLVYGTEVSNITVENITRSSLQHAGELSQLDIPVITIAVSSLTNGYKILSDGLDLRLAGLNIANETLSRTAAGIAGKGAGVLIGPLFGPAGLVVMPMCLGLAGAYNGNRISNLLKRTYTQKERRTVMAALTALIKKVQSALPEKQHMRNENFNRVKHQLRNHKVFHHLLPSLETKNKEKRRYIDNKNDELEKWLTKIHSDRINIASETADVLDTIFRSQVHPHVYQKELLDVGESFERYMRI